ncbi:Ppx/GppA phosphatase family protein [Zhongshania aquatica]|uniref:Ppx/GppA phosphatase family protein n=1 Tax=Zhongshania aquatica TaxID=2965069 RepID=UPI0022B2CA4D|nr:hypothetical protein [Marortus sp. BJYM1]
MILPLGDYMAAIDMGSNSFHLLIAQVQIGGWQTIHTEERKVQLAAGSEMGDLQHDAQQRALACLSEYKSVLARYRITGLHVVATASLRGVNNAAPFLLAVEALMGVCPRIISGEREAELVYLGVTKGCLPAAEEHVQKTYLVVDVGGGSTELAWGLAEQMHSGISVDVGCLRYLRYFPGGELLPAYFTAARDAAAEMFEDALKTFPTSFRESPPVVIGCSGTLLAVEQVLIAKAGGAGKASTGIHVNDLRLLAENLQTFTTIGEVRYQGLSEDRQSVFASGIAIVLALFEVLNIDTMALSQHGLREGIIENCFANSGVMFQQGGQQQ